jgi:esterase
VAENLNVKVTGSGEKRLVLLHGLFGSANNLGQLARAFKEDYVVYSVDLPDHGSRRGCQRRQCRCMRRR